MATAPHDTAAKSPSGNGDRPELAANLPLANNSFINRMAIKAKKQAAGKQRWHKRQKIRKNNINLKNWLAAKHGAGKPCGCDAGNRNWRYRSK